MSILFQFFVDIFDGHSFRCLHKFHRQGFALILLALCTSSFWCRYEQLKFESSHVVYSSLFFPLTLSFFSLQSHLFTQCVFLTNNFWRHCRFRFFAFLLFLSTPFPLARMTLFLFLLFMLLADFLLSLGFGS